MLRSTSRSSQPRIFGGSGFPAEKRDHLSSRESGPTYAPGPADSRKAHLRVRPRRRGQSVTAGPLPLVEYQGAGRGTAVGLAAGPDGLYFTDLYKNFGAATPIDRGPASSGSSGPESSTSPPRSSAGPAPITVHFHDASNVPEAVGVALGVRRRRRRATRRNPVHVYRSGGAYDVRLTVTGAGGAAARRRPLPHGRASSPGARAARPGRLGRRLGPRRRRVSRPARPSGPYN